MHLVEYSCIVLLQYIVYACVYRFKFDIYGIAVIGNYIFRKKIDTV